jgi:hypothetical protein
VIEDGIAQTAVLSMPADKKNHMPGTVLTVKLEKGQPYIDMEITIKDKAKDNWPEADWFCLPFNINKPSFHVARSLGMMDPAKDIVRGANKRLYAVGPGVAITGEDGSDIAVCPLDHPLISLGEPGCWKFSLDYVPQKPVVYINLYNNQWNTNFRYWYPGTWSSRFRLSTLSKGSNSSEALALQSLEVRLPLLAAVAEGKGGELPVETRGLEVSRKGIQITAFGTDSNNSTGTLLRIWEQAGNSGKLTVKLPVGMKVSKVTPVNLRGEKTGETKRVRFGKLKFDLGAYAPASFILE